MTRRQRDSQDDCLPAAAFDRWPWGYLASAVAVGRLLIVACLAMAISAARAEAAEASKKPEPKAPDSAAAVSKPADEEKIVISEPFVPERKLQFVESQEPREMKLFEADPKLLELRYVAVLRMPYKQIDTRQLSPDLQQLVSGAPQLRMATRIRTTVDTEVFLRRVAHDASGSRAQEMLSVLTESGGRRITTTERSNETMMPLVEHNLLTPTVEQAKEMVRALLFLYDQGVSLPAQREYCELQRSCLEDLNQRQRDLPALREKSARARRELQQYEETSQELLTQLKAQQRLATIDIAGVKARIDACNQLLKSVSSGRKEQVETTKIAAEIELVGLTARKKAVDNIVQEAEKRKELVAAYTEASGEAAMANRAIADLRENIRQLESYKEQFRPFPAIEGEIAIHPIKWVPAK